MNKRPAGRELDGTDNRHEEGFDARGEERESGDMGGTEGARVGGMEVGVIAEEEGQPTDQKEGASPAACVCHPRQERKKRSLQLTCPACGQMQADVGQVRLTPTRP